MSISSISPQELADRLERGEPGVVVDVRTPVEFREVHCRPAVNVPLQEISPARLATLGSNGPVYFICKSGGRGRQACEKVAAAGLVGAVNVEGGTQAWIESGLPVVRGRKAVSLERQVRIAAGLLVLVGVLLGWFIDPAFAGLAAFVGAGLIFAGVTDTCGMGMLLARMPWNNVASTCSVGGAK